MTYAHIELMLEALGLASSILGLLDLAAAYPGGYAAGCIEFWERRLAEIIRMAK